MGAIKMDRDTHTHTHKHPGIPMSHRKLGVVGFPNDCRRTSSCEQLMQAELASGCSRQGPWAYALKGAQDLGEPSQQLNSFGSGSPK